MLREILIVWLLCALLGATGLSCAATVVPPPSDPIEAYAGEVTSALQLAAEELTVTVRYNPVSCNCPPFELQLGARWIRLDLRGIEEEGSVAAALLEQVRADLEAGDIKHYALSGDLATDTNTCAQGTLYATFSLASSD